MNEEEDEEEVNVGPLIEREMNAHGGIDRVLRVVLSPNSKFFLDGFGAPVS
jgi:hypothetical protein